MTKTPVKQIIVTPVPGDPVLSQLSIDEQINWFEAAIKKWIFDPVELLLETKQPNGDPNPDVDIAILNILNALPEMLGQYQTGKQEGELYKHGFLYIFSSKQRLWMPKIVDQLWNDLRSALAHTLFMGKGVILDRKRPNLSHAVTNHPQNSNFVVFINAPEWHEQTKKRVGDYINELRDVSKKELRQNFSDRIVASNSKKPKNSN